MPWKGETWKRFGTRKAIGAPAPRASGATSAT